MNTYIKALSRITNAPTLTVLVLLLSVLFNVNTAFAAKLYKWVDKDGNVSYQDSPPPLGSKIEREEEINPPSNSEPISTQPTEPITVYTVEDCESCDLLMLRLQNWEIPFTEESLQDRDIQARILELSDSLSAPTLFIGDNLISNLTGSSLISELQQAGYQVDSSSNSNNGSDSSETIELETEITE